MVPFVTSGKCLYSALLPQRVIRSSDQRQVRVRSDHCHCRRTVLFCSVARGVQEFLISQGDYYLFLALLALHFQAQPLLSRDGQQWSRLFMRSLGSYIERSISRIQCFGRLTIDTCTASGHGASVSSRLGFLRAVPAFARQERSRPTTSPAFASTRNLLALSLAGLVQLTIHEPRRQCHSRQSRIVCRCTCVHELLVWHVFNVQIIS